RDRPVSRSETICARVTAPKRENASWRSSAVVAKARLPTYRFFIIIPRGPQRAPLKSTYATPSCDGAEERGERQTSPPLGHTPRRGGLRHDPQRERAASGEPGLSDSTGLTISEGCEKKMLRAETPRKARP